MKKLIAALTAFFCLLPSAGRAWTHGQSSGSVFNGGKFQLNTNFIGIGGDYPLLNLFQNSSGGWTYRDNSGFPAPDELDDYGYPLSGSSGIVSHTGLFLSVRLPSQAYIGGNCIPAQTGVCITKRVNGKGTVPLSANGIITSNSGGGTSTVTTGATTTITFSQAQDFRAGMEVPITGTTGVTATNGGGGSLTGGGTTGAWTVCAAGLTPTTIQLCLNDQVTPLQTTGTPAGTTSVSYGRIAVGVPSGGRYVELYSAGLTSANVAISATDATTPITYRNGIDGLVYVLQGSEETRYEQGQIFGAKFLNTLIAGKPGVLRALNALGTNVSQEINWSDRMPSGYYAYGAPRHNRGQPGSATSVWAGTTTSAQNAYSITFGSGAPVDKQQMIIAFDAAPVTVTDSSVTGQPALVSWTSHGLQTGSPIYFVLSSGSSVPGGLRVSSSAGTSAAAATSSSATTYFAITSCGGPCDANTIRVATSKANALAGTAVSTTSTGANVLAHATSTPDTVTMTASNATIAWSDNLLTVGDLVTCNAAAAPFFSSGIYKAVTVNPNDVQLAFQDDAGSTPIVPAVSGSFQCTKTSTLNLNGTGPRAFLNPQGNGQGFFGRSDQPKARSGAIIIRGNVTYDGVLGAWIKSGGDISIGNTFFFSGWPPELWLELCRQVGAHPWYPPPAYVVDGVNGITDYLPNLYSYVRANGQSWMIPRFEVTPNEFWNTSGNSATGPMIGHASVYASANLPLYAGWSTNSGIYQIAGKIGSVLGQAINNAYGNPPIDGTQRYEAPLGVQTNTFSQTSGATNNAPRMTSSDYVAQSTPAQSPYLKAAASGYATSVAGTIYVSPGLWQSGRAVTLATAYGRGLITGSIAVGTDILNVTNSGRFGSGNPTLGIGTVLVQGPGIQPGTTIIGGSAPNWQLDRTYAYPVGSTNIATLASTSDPTAIQEMVDSFGYNSTFTGTIASSGCVSGGGPTLTVTGITGYINTTNTSGGGDFLYGAGVTQFTRISSQQSGTVGSNGVYCLGSAHANLGPITMQSAGTFSIPALTTMYSGISSFAALYPSKDGLAKGKTSYEGGPAIDYDSQGLSLLDQFYAAMKVVQSTPLKPSTGIGGWSTENMQAGKALGFDYPSLFQFTGLTPTSNGYSSNDDIYTPDSTPIWNSYVNYN